MSQRGVKSKMEGLRKVVGRVVGACRIVTGRVAGACRSCGGNVEGRQVICRGYAGERQGAGMVQSTGTGLVGKS